ncbi:MotA/TolQ/ExbB proton channel family protein, partial [Sutterella sp.]|uniref:MotA/TolQ/ExbB proton channel family protein n=1 Tax=Sutterella sp. TaxID=1981025 RepID=UPI0026DEBDA5
LENTLGQFRAGGPFMIPIAAASVVMLCLGFLEVRSLVRAERELKSRMAAGRFGGDDEWGSLAAIYREGRSGLAPVDLELRDAIRDWVMTRLGRSRAVLFLASVATLLGLLGTVSGMMNSFEAISLTGFADIRSMSSGVSQALITTQSGLMIAVVGVVLGRWIRARAEALGAMVSEYLALAGGEKTEGRLS